MDKVEAINKGATPPAEYSPVIRPVSEEAHARLRAYWQSRGFPVGYAKLGGAKKVLSRFIPRKPKGAQND
jgi:hypothetical protein